MDTNKPYLETGFRLLKTLVIESLQGGGCQLGQASPTVITLIAEAAVGLPMMWLLFTGAHPYWLPGPKQSHVCLSSSPTLIPISPRVI